MPDLVRKSFTFEGKRYWVRGKNEEDAIVQRAVMLAELKRGSTQVSGSMTVRQWAKIWLETYIDSRDITAKSAAMYHEKLNIYILPIIGTKKMRDIRDIHLQQLLNDLAGKSTSTVAKVRMILQAMFHQAVRSRIISYDPAEDITMPRTVEGEKRPITEAERAAVYAVAKWHRSGLWVMTLLRCGLRPGETVPLKWKDIDIDGGWIHVHTALESGADNIKETKTIAGFRDVPIPEDLLAMLAAQQGQPEEYVFTQVLPQNKGKRHTKDSLASYWASFKRELDLYMAKEKYRDEIEEKGIKAVLYRNQILKHGLPEYDEDHPISPLTPYCFRHTYATDLQEAGVPLNIAKASMGHSDISVTANIYTHTTDSTLREAAERLNALEAKKSPSAPPPAEEGVTISVTGGDSLAGFSFE